MNKSDYTKTLLVLLVIMIVTFNLVIRFFKFLYNEHYFLSVVILVILIILFGLYINKKING